MGASCMNIRHLNKWDRKFLDVAILTGSWSKDPKHKIGAVIVNEDNIILSGGYNGFPRDVIDDDRLKYSNRLIKNQIIVHAEINAIAAAARLGHALKGSTIYCTMPPCSQCASAIIQVGIQEAIFFGNTTAHWKENMDLAKTLLDEASVNWKEVSINGTWTMQRVKKQQKSRKPVVV